MVKIVDKQNIFNSGIISPKLHSRDDLKQFNNGVYDANNFICSRYGPIEKRVGTKFIWDLNNPDEPVFFLPFVFSIKQSLLLEFLANKIRFYTFDGLEFGPIADPKHPNQQYEVATPFTANQLKDISYVQSLDVVYLAFADKKTPPYKLSRYANNNWKLELFETEDGPYLDQNYNATRKVTITDKNTNVSKVTLTGFTLGPKDIGRWFRVNTPRYNENTFVYEDKWSYGKIQNSWTGSWKATITKLYTKTATPGKEDILYRDSALTQIYMTNTYGPRFEYEGGQKAVRTTPGGVFILQKEKEGAAFVWKCRYEQAYAKPGPLKVGDPLYKQAEYIDVIGSVYKINKANDIVIKLKEDSYITNPNFEAAFKGLTNDIEVKWSYRNKVDETDQSWMTAATSEWRLGAWHTGHSNPDYPVTYPTKVSIHQQRLVWAGITDKPWVWTSNSFAYTNYAPSDYEGNIADSNSINADISTDKVSEIFWVKSVKSLLIGTELGEVRMSSAGTALTPSDYVTNRESSYGCYNEEPIVTDDMIIFIQRLQRTLRSLTYDDNMDAYVGPELTILAENLTAGGIKKIVYQKEPNNTIWCLKENGELLTLTYDRTQEVIGWSKSKLAGAGAKVIDLAVLPSNVYQQDMVLMAVERTVHGQHKRYLELLSKNFVENVEHKDACFVDCATHIINPEGFDIIEGLDFLEGEEVLVTDEGAINGTYTVENGSITLEKECRDVWVGLPYNAYFETLERDFQDKQLSTKMSKLRVYKLRMYLNRTLGVSLQRLTQGSVTKLITFDPTEETDTVPELITGMVDIEVPSAWDCDYRLRITSAPGLPCTVSGIIIGVEINAI